VLGPNKTSKKFSVDISEHDSAELSMKTTYWATFDIPSTKQIYNHSQLSREATDCLLYTAFMYSSLRKRYILKRLTTKEIRHILSCNYNAQLR